MYFHEHITWSTKTYNGLFVDYDIMCFTIQSYFFVDIHNQNCTGICD